MTKKEELDETLKEVEAFAALAMSAKDIELVLDLFPGSISNYLKFSKASQFAQAYLKGKLKLQSEVNKSIINLAKQGSGPAQTMAKKLIADQTAKEVDFE